MAFTHRTGLAMTLTILFMAAIIPRATSLSMKYCASINTDDGEGTRSDFQSNGLCKQQCEGKTAYAVLQRGYCWCSDFTPDPSTQVGVDKCDSPCPGNPKGTKGGADPPATKPTVALPTLPATIITTTVTAADKEAGPPPAPPTTSASTAASIFHPITPPTTTTTKSQPGPTHVDTPGPVKDTPDPAPSIATVTQGGVLSLKTITIAPASPTAANAGSTSNSLQSSSEPSSGSGVSAGAVAGIVVGILAVAALTLAAFFWMRRRKRLEVAQSEEGPNSARGSSAGIMSTPRTEMASVWDEGASSAGRRGSRLMPRDPRMDPVTNIYNRFDNKSQESVNTIRDNHDYSRRVLRPTNPDPSQD